MAGNLGTYPSRERLSPPTKAICLVPYTSFVGFKLVATPRPTVSTNQLFPLSG